MNDKISIIVPAYNAQKFISKCIRSTLKQSYQNWEMIIIDDGSYDKTLKICRRFEKKDGRIRVFAQKNSGASSARNFGLDVSEGSCVLFLDSDDWLPNNSLELMYNALTKNDAQLSVGTLCVYSSKCDQIKSKNVIINKDDSCDFCDYILNDKPIMYMAAKLFYSDIIKQNNIRFSKDMKISEDTCFVLNYLKHAKRVACIDDVVYNYNRLLDSSVSQRFYKDRIDWILFKYKLQLDLCSEYVQREDIRKLCADEFRNVFVWCLLHYIQNSVEIEEILQIIVRSLDELLEEPALRFLFEHKDDSDEFFELVKQRNAAGLYDYAKARERVVTTGRFYRVKKLARKIISRLKAWYISNF